MARTSSGCGARRRCASRTAEQALLLGHPLHPTPKGLCGRLRQYTPELQPHFQLHWLSVDADIVAHDSATGTPAPQLAARLFGREAPHGRILIPAHPWEAGYLARAASHLFTAGDVIDLGPDGDAVTPTTSVRTVYRADWPYMLKFSLHARVTNSMRVSLPKELRRAVEAARLAQTPVGEAARRIAPGSRSCRTPRTCRSRARTASPCSSARTAGRASADVTALTVLCQDHPFGGRPGWRRRRAGGAGRARSGSRATGRRRGLAVRLYLELGLCFEPHQQNTLLELDGGWPARCVVRDSQGYFHREAAHADLCAVIPALGEASESIFPEALADERLVYYPFVNNALGVIDALGGGRLRRRARAAARPAGGDGARARPRRPLSAHAAGPPARRRAVAVQGQPAHAPERHGRAGRRHRRAVGLRDAAEPVAGPARRGRPRAHGALVARRG